MSKIVVDMSEIAGIIRESVRQTLLGHACAARPKGLTIAITTPGPEVYALRDDQLEAALRELGNNVAASLWAHGIEIDFDSATAEEDPSLFVVELRDAWQQLKEG